MTPEQLASVRAAHWREDARPILTLDDAKAWLERMQLCLYLPRKTHLLAPAPSFVGAVLGSSIPTPSPETIAQAHHLLVRLVAEGYIVPLNLFGVPGEQPDFLIRTSALSHLAALQADRNWKKAPARTGPGKVSPLAIEVWKLLDREGALTATEIRNHLGHELTEAATIRALSELWQNLRVAPLPQPNGEAANWEILSVTHKKEMAAGGTMAQSTALSLLVSYYLQSVLTATAEDIEAFLSPVASRTRLRDVIRGLSATRQLRTLSMDAQTFLFIEGTLPDTADSSSAEIPAADKPAFMGRSAYRERMLHKVKEPTPQEEDTSPRTYKDRREVSSSDGPGRTFPDQRPGPVAPRPARFAAAPGKRPAGPPFAGRNRSAPSRPSSGRSSSERSSRPSSARPFRAAPSTGGGDAPARPFRAREGADRPTAGRPGTDRPSAARDGSRPPFQRSRPPFRDKPGSRTAPGGARSFPPRTEGDRPAKERTFRKDNGEGRPFAPRPGAGRPSRRPPYGGVTSKGVTRPFRPRTEENRPGADRPGRRGTGTSTSSGPGSFRAGRGAARPSFRGKSVAGSDRPFRPRPEGDKPPYPRRESGPGDRSKGRPSNRFDARSGERPANPSRPPRPTGTFSRRPDPPPRSSGSGNRPASRPGAVGRNPGGTGRPGGPRFGASRTGSRPGSRAGTSSTAGPGATRRARPSGPRPGGMRPPTRKPRKPESDSE